jgi:hypothetical protein
MRTQWSEGLCAIHTSDGQHLSRLTDIEVRELVFQIIVFGPRKLRAEIAEWLTSRSVETVAQVIGCKEQANGV